MARCATSRQRVVSSPMVSMTSPRKVNTREHYLLDCDSPISEADAQAVLAGYMQDPKLLPELRFWVANQGVAINVIANYKTVAEGHAGAQSIAEAAP